MCLFVQHGTYDWNFKAGQFIQRCYFVTPKCCHTKNQVSLCLSGFTSIVKFLSDLQRLAFTSTVPQPKRIRSYIDFSEVCLSRLTGASYLQIIEYLNKAVFDIRLESEWTNRDNFREQEKEQELCRAIIFWRCSLEQWQIHLIILCSPNLPIQCQRLIRDLICLIPMIWSLLKILFNSTALRL